MKGFVACTILVLQITGSHCLGNGAPTSVCGSMTPAHNAVTPMTTTSPYTITASATTYTPAQEITVTIGATGAQTHGGLLVQARKSDDSSITPIGTFKTPSANTKLMTCTTADSSWTHSASTAKTTSTVIWIAPASDAGTIVFKATIATDHDNYWLDHKSAALTYTGLDATTEPGPMETTTGNSSTKSVVSCLLIVMCLLGLRM